MLESDYNSLWYGLSSQKVPSVSIGLTETFGQPLEIVAIKKPAEGATVDGAVDVFP